MIYGFLILNYGFLIVNYGFFIIDYGILIIDYGFVKWITDSLYSCSCHRLRIRKMDYGFIIDLGLLPKINSRY